MYNNLTMEKALLVRYRFITINGTHKWVKSIRLSH